MVGVERLLSDLRVHAAHAKDLISISSTHARQLTIVACNSSSGGGSNPSVLCRHLHLTPCI